MGTVIFWICFGLLILLLVVSGITRSGQIKAARLKKLRDIFESASDKSFDTCGNIKESGLFRHMSSRDPKDFVIDDITASDLMLDEVYARMNRCVTNAGEDHLYSSFRIMKGDPERAAKAFERISVFMTDKEQAHRLRSILSVCPKTEDTDGYALIKSLNDAPASPLARDIIPLACLAAAFVLTAFSALYGVIAVIVMICVCIATYFSGRRMMDQNLRGLALCIRYIDCSQKLFRADCREFERYKDLSALKGAGYVIAMRDATTSNPLDIILDYVRMITHIDLIVYKISISGIRTHIDGILDLYENIGRLDADMATASYLQDRPFCRAVIEDNRGLSAQKIYHPLIKDPVLNDIDTKKGMILTGSNASGKSTFLKAVGISAVFAASFGFAFAGSFEMSPFRLYTSMALSDNLLGGESYYVVEARSIKRICDAASEGNVLCIIDEVLRGTNTVERIAASSKILEFLCRPGVLCFAATHDLELPMLLEDEMDPYYFTEEIDGDNVVFTYTIHKGISDRTNAIRLLSVLGFDGKITEGADRIAGMYRQTGKWENGK